MDKTYLESMVIDIPEKDVELAEEYAEHQGISVDEFMDNALHTEIQHIIDTYMDQLAIASSQKQSMNTFELQVK